MNPSTVHRPDRLIFVLAYLLILSLSALYGGSIILSTALPAVRVLGMGELSVLINGIASLMLGGVPAWAAWLLWRLNPAGCNKHDGELNEITTNQQDFTRCVSSVCCFRCWLLSVRSSPGCEKVRLRRFPA